MAVVCCFFFFFKRTRFAFWPLELPFTGTLAVIAGTPGLMLS